MPGVFDRLQKALDLDKREEGISPLDIASLPPNLRKIMRLMVREVQMSYLELCQAVEEMPEESRLSQPELDAALRELTVQGWLIKRGEGERLSYQVNLRRRPPSKIAQGIWSMLDDRIGKTKEEQKPDA